MRMISRAAVAFAALAFCGPAFAAQEFTCRVAAVLDGDTLSCIGHDEKIRLADIDAPETAKPGKKGQPYGEEARRALFAMADKKDVLVKWSKHDKYGRKVATVYVGKTDINAEMVRGGHAWVYDKYVEKGARAEFLGLLENQAQNAKLGIWSLPVSQQVAPWDFRAGKTDSDDQSVDPGIVGAPECGTKKTCGQMTSCAEATAFFTQCKGMGGLDGDRDGKPCNSLCR